MRADTERLLLKYEPRLWKLTRRQLQTMHRLYANVMANEMNTLLVAADGRDRPIGMIMVRTLNAKHMNPTRMGRIDDAWVEPRWRRRGVMRQLVRAACDFVERHGARDMMLDYSIRNLVSVKAWTGLGFRPTVMIAFATTRELRKRSPGGRR
jgi:GNAT superfamily N-acetyltransferase